MYVRVLKNHFAIILIYLPQACRFEGMFVYVSEFRYLRYLENERS